MKVWLKLDPVVGKFNSSAAADKMDGSTTHQRVTTAAPSGSRDASNTNFGHSNVNIVTKGDSSRAHIGHDNRNNRGIVVNVGNTIFPDPTELSEILNELRRAPAYYDSSLRKQAQECLQETRVAILSTIYEWVDSLDDPPIFWLHGQAGAGRSTIAHTVAEKCRRRGILGASFFFAHANAECSDPNLFFSTIAYHLSKSVPDLRQHIIDGVRAHPSPQDASIPTQLEEFILTPLRKLPNGPTRDPIIVVVDAFDECSDARKASEILQLLSAKIPSFRLRLKILITSRPEPEIRSILHPDIDRVSRSFDLLRDVDACSTDEDIKRFLRFYLSMIGKEYNLPSWPQEMDVETLAQHAAGLFIFAHTAIELIRDKDVMDPESQLAMLKNIGSDGTHAFNLHALYSRILWKAIPETASTTVQERVITVIHAIVGLRAPLALWATERLLRLDRGAMHSIFIVPDNDEDTVQIIHPSFARYWTDEESCNGKRFSVGHRQLHGQLAKHCLKQMKTHLKQNICNFKDFATVEAPIKDGDLDLQMLSADLRYSCENFAAHVISADWQDVLALTGSIRDALPSLRLLSNFCEIASASHAEPLRTADSNSRVQRQPSNAAQSKSQQFFRRLLPERHKARTVASKLGPQSTSHLIADAIRMVSESYDDMKIFPYQIYTSCLTFCPLDSPLFKQYSQLSTFRVLRGKRKNWGALLHAFKDSDGSVVSLTFSPDGTILASCSSAGKILLWSLETSESRLLTSHTLCRHTAFTFSPDSKYIAADGNVYRVATGEMVLMPGNCSAFSLDGLHIALGCADGIIRLHDMPAPNLSLLAELFGHGRMVTTLAFSSDNKYLASATGDGTILVWNCSSLEMIRQILCPESFDYLTFSPNGTYVAARYRSFVRDKEYFWVADIQTGEEKFINLLGYLCKASTMFSPSGDYIASCDDEALYVTRWATATPGSGDTFISPEFDSGITFISFTPDEQSILVGDKQGLIRSWRIPKDGRSADTFDFECKAHFRAVQAINFSHDSKYFASASKDGSICVWDSTSVAFHEPDLTHTVVLRRQKVTFAPDGQTVAIGSGFTIAKMDATTGRSIFHITSTLLDEGKHLLIFSADGKYLFSNKPKKLFLWDTGSHCTLGKRRMPWVTEERKVVAHALSPDGTHYAALFSAGELWVYDLRNGEGRRIVHANRMPHVQLGFSHNSRYLVSYLWNICLFDVEEGVQKDLNIPARSYILDCAFSPCGQHITIAHDSGLDVLEYFAKKPNVMEVHREGGYWSVEYSSDGQYILAAADWQPKEPQLELFHPDTLQKLYTIKIWSGKHVYHAIREFRRTGRLLNHPSFQPSEYENFPYLLDNDGWVITASSKRLCRLPVANRGKAYDVNGNRLVIVSPEEKVTLVQFGPNPICIATSS